MQFNAHSVFCQKNACFYSETQTVWIAALWFCAALACSVRWSPKQCRATGSGNGLEYDVLKPWEHFPLRVETPHSLLILPRIPAISSSHPAPWCDHIFTPKKTSKKRMSRNRNNLPSLSLGSAEWAPHIPTRWIPPHL